MIPHLPGDSPQIKLLNECSRGFNEMNMDVVGKCLHKDFHHVIYPLSVGGPALDKEGWLKRMAELGTGYGVGYITYCSDTLPPTYTPLQQTFHSVVEAPGKVIIHVRIPIHLDYSHVYLTHTAVHHGGGEPIRVEHQVRDDVHLAHRYR
jgi:hypothetical protein